MRRLVKLLSLFYLLVFCYPSSAYVIHGQFKNYSSKWGNKVYFAAIRSINEFQSISPQMQINEAEMDSEGNFKISGTNLPDNLAFYRIYICQKGSTSQFLHGADHNYIHLLLNNESDVTINIDLENTPVYMADIKGSPYIDKFTDYYKNIYYITEQNFTNPYTQIPFDGQKAFELVKHSIVKNDNPYYTIFALSINDLSNKYSVDAAFFDRTIAHLKKQLPNNSYVTELDDKYMIAAFRMSPLKAYLNTQTFIVLVSIVIVLVIAIGYLLWLRRKKDRTIPVAPIPVTSLTQKELEIARMIVTGKSNKEISALLFIEVSTVKSHVGNIYKKLDVSNRKDLADRLGSS